MLCVSMMVLFLGANSVTGFLLPVGKHNNNNICQQRTTFENIDNHQQQQQRPSQGSPSCCFMGYLDELSSASSSEESSSSSSSSASSQPQQPNVASNNNEQSKRGFVPSGRGPMGSYFDAMSSGSRSSQQQNTNDDDDEQTSNDDNDDALKSAATGWSTNYLRDIIHTTQNNAARTDLRNFLTQRAVQTFLFLLEQCRDPHSARWLQQDFLLEPGNLLEYHGTGAGFLERFETWDTPLRLLLHEPVHIITVAAKRRGRGQGGWSQHNPFLEERWMELSFEIDPPNLAQRILSVRTQIAHEWVHDLDQMLWANHQLLEDYSKAAILEDGESSPIEILRQPPIPTVTADSGSSNFSTQSSSPFRKGTLDLLQTLSLQAAIHQILQDNDTMKEGKDLLLDFYQEYAAAYFDGDLPFGRARAFLMALWESSNAADRLVADLLRQQNRVLEEWQTIAAAVPSDHSALQAVLLSVRFEQQQQDGTSSTREFSNLQDRESSKDAFQ